MQNNILTKSKHLLKYHLHILLYVYFLLGLFVCGLFAPDDRVLALESALITEGWHLSALSVLLILPVPVLYYLRLRKPDST